MTVPVRPHEVVGNPVRRERLLRALRSNTNATILGVWTGLVALAGILVLANQVGLSHPFDAPNAAGDNLGAALGQWWIVTITVGSMLLAVTLTAFACAAAGEHDRIQAWSTTLVRPWRVALGIWQSQLALLALGLVLAFPVAGIALASGGTTLRQAGVGLAGAAVAGATCSAITIAVACRARRVIAPLVISLLFVVAIVAGPYAAHVARNRPAGDPVMAIMPLVGVADAVAPLPQPAMRFCAFHGCDWEATDSSDAPLHGLRATVQPWSGGIPAWGWTAGGAVIVTLLSLLIARFRIARPPRS